MDREKQRNSVSGTERGRGQNIKREGNNTEIGRERRYIERWLFLFWRKKINLDMLIPINLLFNIQDIL